MTPDQWQRLKAIFEHALDRTAHERAAFIDQACGADAVLRREIESLLAADEAAGDFLESALARRLARPDLQEHFSVALADRYRLERELGGGGMSRVFLARETALGRRVVVKVLPELANAVDIERFRREVRVAAGLQHPHIVPLLASGEAGGLVYYTMPFVEGESLRERLGREVRLQVDAAVLIAREVADALSYAHGQGIVHRDVKPENILLSAGHAVVTDFGIARALEAAEDQPDARLTKSGILLGTAAYMSPEQAAGERKLGGYTDIYALGCVLHEMLAGNPPWTGPNPVAIIAQRFSDPPVPLRSLQPTVPESVERIVLTALALESAERFATAAEFRDALPILPSLPAPARAPQVHEVSSSGGWAGRQSGKPSRGLAGPEAEFPWRPGVLFACFRSAWSLLHGRLTRVLRR
jgi:serine/threonine-protein kinase